MDGSRPPRHRRRLSGQQCPRPPSGTAPWWLHIFAYADMEVDMAGMSESSINQSIQE